MKMIFALLLTFSILNHSVHAQDTQNLNMIESKNGCTPFEYCKGDRILFVSEPAAGSLDMRAIVGTAQNNSKFPMMKWDHSDYKEPLPSLGLPEGRYGRGVRCFQEFCVGYYAEIVTVQPSMTVKIYEIYDNGIAAVRLTQMGEEFLSRPSPRENLLMDIRSLTNPQKLTYDEIQVMKGQRSFKALEGYRQSKNHF
jgi:hypothetical protein